MKIVIFYVIITLINSVCKFFKSKNHVHIYRRPLLLKRFKFEIYQMTLGSMLIVNSLSSLRLQGSKNSDIFAYLGAIVVLHGISNIVVKLTNDSISNKYIIKNSQRIPLYLVKEYEFKNRIVHEDHEYCNLNIELQFDHKYRNRITTKLLIKLKLIEKIGTIKLEIKCSDIDTVDEYLLGNMRKNI